jgi:tetratricopeptide (TPR) repeat protein
MSLRRAARRAVLGLGAMAALSATAQPVAEPAWRAALEAHRDAEVERLAAERLAASPADPDAWSVLVRVARATADSDLKAAIRKRLEACVAPSGQPRVALCHFGVGALAWQDAGAVGLALRGGRIRDELGRALDLDPLLFAARLTLVQYYLDAGRFGGGSLAKAREVTEAAAARQPEHAKFLSAVIEEHEGHADDAAALLAAVACGDDRELAEGVQAHWASLAEYWMTHKDPAKARAVYERFAKERPADPAPRMAVVRAAMLQKDYDAAIAQLDAMDRFPGRQALALDYRLGVAWQAKGDAGRARAAFMRFLASPAERDPEQVEDAKSRLADMR